MPVIYSARWVLPIASPPIKHGGIAIDGSRIVAVGSRDDLAAKFPEEREERFGDAVILPGLINTHSHLELSVMRGFLEAEELDFLAWLRKLTIARMAMTEEDLFVSATWGVIEAARAGITCLGDSSSFAQQAMRALKSVGLRGVVYQESFGPDPSLAQQNVDELRGQLDVIRKLETTQVRAGVSPHAPYTVSAPQLELISQLAICDKLPVMMHAAESEAERSFLMKGEGAFAEGLRKRGIAWKAPGLSTIQYLDRHGVLETKPLLAHCIHVDASDVETIKQRQAGVAHCPKSNAKLRHGRAPFADFIAKGLRVGLGSDSVVSNNTCDILEEARFALLLSRAVASEETKNTITAKDALFAATLGGARSLAMEDQIGALAVGFDADITVVKLSGAQQQPCDSPEEALIFSSSASDVMLTMVAGEVVYREGKINNLDEAGMNGQLRESRSRIEGASFDIDPFRKP